MLVHEASLSTLRAMSQTLQRESREKGAVREFHTEPNSNPGSAT